MTQRNAHDVVRLATANTPAQAHILEQALQAEGIEATVVGDYLDASFGDIPGLKAEVWVHRDDLPAAEAVLQRGQTAAGEEAPDESEA